MSTVVDPNWAIKSNLYIKGQHEALESFKDICDSKMAWTVAGFKNSLDNDALRFFELSPMRQALLRSPHGFFAVADNISNENMYSYLLPRYDLPIIRYILSIFGLSEMRHMEAYMHIYRMLFKTLEEMLDYTDKHLSLPSVKKMIDWMRLGTKYANPFTHDIFELLLSQLFSEGVFFQFPFTIIFLFKHLGLLKGITGVNDAINWDEDKHITFTMWLIFFELKRQNKTLADIAPLVLRHAQEAYELASLYIDDVFAAGVEEVGFTKEANQLQLKYVIRQRLKPFGMSLTFTEATESPFSWLVMTELEGKTNFFEFDVPEYGQNKAMLPENMTSSSTTSLVVKDGAKSQKKEATREVLTYTFDQYAQMSFLTENIY